MKKLGHFWFAPRILLILLAALLICGIIFVGACVGYGRSFLDIVGYDEEVSKADVINALEHGEDISYLGLTDVEISNAVKAYQKLSAPLALRDTQNTTTEELLSRLERQAAYNATRASAYLTNYLLVSTDKDDTEMILCVLLSLNSKTGGCVITSLPSYMLVLDDELGMTKLGNVYFRRGIKGVAEDCGKMFGLTVSETGKLNIGSAAELITAADTDFGYEIIVSNSGIGVKHNSKPLTFSALDKMLRLLVRDVRTDMDTLSLYRFALGVRNALKTEMLMISPAAIETSAVTTYDGNSALVVDFIAARSLLG